jgi:hypothetical protein
MTDDRQTAREPGAQDATSSAGIQCNKPGGGGMQTAESFFFSKGGKKLLPDFY